VLTRAALQRVAELRPPAGPGDLAAAERALGAPIPPSLAGLLRVSDGLRTDTVTSYAAEELAERNQTFEVAEYLPGRVLIGDNGGGVGFLIAASAGDPAVVPVGLGSLLESDLEVVAESLSAWAADGFRERAG
jgi:hypothetical protein